MFLEMLLEKMAPRSRIGFDKDPDVLQPNESTRQAYELITWDNSPSSHSHRMPTWASVSVISCEPQ